MLKDYFDELTDDLARESDRIRQYFASHVASAGANREDLVAKLLRSHILPAAGVETGLILSASGELSNQSDVVLVDRTSNGPLHGDRPIPLWLLESVYAVIEVKTQLTPTTIADSVQKSVRLKRLAPNYADSLGQQKITDTLFCLWSFECPDNLQLAKSNISSAMSGIPHHQHPDFIVVPGRFLWRGGHYYDVSANGQKGSPWHQMRLAEVNGDESQLLVPGFKMLDLGPNTLFTFLYWLNSWLYAAGPRRPNILAYYPVKEWGSLV